MSGDKDNKSESGQGKEELRCDEEQYKLLKECSDNGDITPWNKWLEQNPDKEIWLQGAYFLGANLQGADLRRANLLSANFEKANLQAAELTLANLESACLMKANLQEVRLIVANLKDALFMEANLENAVLYNANLIGCKIVSADIKGADFQRAIVDGETIIWECKVNRHHGREKGTNFHGVGLNSIRIDAATKQLLEYNIRRMNWEKWYEGESENKLIFTMRKFLTSPVRLFWSMSDYGLSTMRIIGTFFLLALLFAAIYANCAHFCPPGIVDSLTVEPHFPLWHYFLLLILRPVYFSVVTMTTLGFGDMYAQKQSIAGHLLLTFQVILGYVLLGALVTRFAVLFTAGGPAGKFTPMDKEIG
ncbi:MAG: pentapeptide repeat-containing protein [Phycisphaerae bacterium]|jgi:uncharacterized protein YjbI with pentapeptide repeats